MFHQVPLLWLVLRRRRPAREPFFTYCGLFGTLGVFTFYTATLLPETAYQRYRMTGGEYMALLLVIVGLEIAMMAQKNPTLARE